MRDAVIVEAVRTPVGKRGKALAEVHPADLSAHVDALVARTGFDPGVVDDVAWGCMTQIGEQTLDITRTAALAAGRPEWVTGVTVDRQFGSSRRAMRFAAAGLGAGGIESLSLVRWPALGRCDRGPYGDELPDQGLGAEMIATKWGLGRAEPDRFALTSHELAAAAVDSGDRMLPMEVRR